MVAMSLLAAILILAQAPAASEEVPKVREYLMAGETSKALAVLKEIASHKGNHAEAKELIKLVRSSRPKKPPEVVEACFLSLKGIGSRKVTKQLMLLLKTAPYRKDKNIRIGVCRALSGSADPAGVDALIDSLRDREDAVIAEAAAAAGAYRYAKDSIRKELFKKILDVYESAWNLKNSVNPDLRVERARAERKWAIIEVSMEKSLQLLSNVTMDDPPKWRRWWNKNKKKRWAELDQ
jgi:HEAT repeat protein